MEEVKIPTCSMCGRVLGQLIGDTIYCSSDYIGGPMCHSCQVEHCVATNCLACEIGSYPNCEHLERKKYYLTPEED